MRAQKSHHSGASSREASLLFAFLHFMSIFIHLPVARLLLYPQPSEAFSVLYSEYLHLHGWELWENGLLLFFLTISQSQCQAQQRPLIKFLNNSSLPCPNFIISVLRVSDYAFLPLQASQNRPCTSYVSGLCGEPSSFNQDFARISKSPLGRIQRPHSHLSLENNHS